MAVVTSLPADGTKDQHEHHHICFCLQTLAELIPYPGVRTWLFRLRVKDVIPDHVVDQSFVRYIIARFSGLGNVNQKKGELGNKYRLVEARWASVIIAGLVDGNSDQSVVEAVVCDLCEVMTYALHTKADEGNRAGQFLGILQLSNCLCTGHFDAVNITGHSATINDVSQLLLKGKFPDLLVQAMAIIDFNATGSRYVASQLLRSVHYFADALKRLAESGKKEFQLERPASDNDVSTDDDSPDTFMRLPQGNANTGMMMFDGHDGTLGDENGHLLSEALQMLTPHDHEQVRIHLQRQMQALANGSISINVGDMDQENGYDSAEEEMQPQLSVDMRVAEPEAEGQMDTDDGEEDDGDEGVDDEDESEHEDEQATGVAESGPEDEEGYGDHDHGGEWHPAADAEWDGGEDDESSTPQFRNPPPPAPVNYLTPEAATFPHTQCLRRIAASISYLAQHCVSGGASSNSSR